MNLIRVTDTKAIIKDASDTQIGSFEIANFNATFSVGSIPTCTVILSTGSTFNKSINTGRNAEPQTL